MALRRLLKVIPTFSGRARRSRRGAPAWPRALLVLMSAGLAGCGTMTLERAAPDELPVITGPAVRRNFTPMESAFGCLAQGMRSHRRPVIGVGVGDIKDYTGKYSTLEGNALTQGGALMAYSALGKLGGVIQIQERFDTRIAELELAYADRRQLGDGRTHTLEAGKPPVPWLPYFGGTIMRSGYYIVGGITELNYNIGSAGAELTVSGVGGKNRVFAMNVGVDLRIVDTRSLMVLKTVSLQKQIVGREVGASVYRFFGTDLFDLNVGAKAQEPLQLGVRTTIEQGVIELVAAVSELDPAPCLVGLDGRAENERQAVPLATGQEAARSLAPTGNGGPKRDGEAVRPPGADLTRPTSPPQNAIAAPKGATQQVAFELGSNAISGEALAAIEQTIASAAQGNEVTLHLVARETESWPPVRRREVAEERVRAVVDALVARGLSRSRVETLWLPGHTDSAITRHGPGFQLVASLSIRR